MLNSTHHRKSIRKHALRSSRDSGVSSCMACPPSEVLIRATTASHAWNCRMQAPRAGELNNCSSHTAASRTRSIPGRLGTNYGMPGCLTARPPDAIPMRACQDNQQQIPALAVRKHAQVRAPVGDWCWNFGACARKKCGFFQVLFLLPIT